MNLIFFIKIMHYVYFCVISKDPFASVWLHNYIPMSFQAYIDNIKKKTGKTPEEFKAIAEEKGLLKEGVKAGEIVAWLKKDFELGHGHAMAIYATFKGYEGKPG
jgi:hypothetical protein